MRYILIAACTFFATCAFSQKSITWIGGTPGKETNWNEARNWSGHTLPNEFSNVIIPDVSSSTFSYPVIKDGIVELNSLLVVSSALIVIEPGAELIIDGYAEGLTPKTMQLRGSLMIQGKTVGSDKGNMAVKQ